MFNAEYLAELLMQTDPVMVEAALEIRRSRMTSLPGEQPAAERISKIGSRMTGQPGDGTGVSLPAPSGDQIRAASLADKKLMDQKAADVAAAVNARWAPSRRVSSADDNPPEMPSERQLSDEAADLSNNARRETGEVISYSQAYAQAQGYYRGEAKSPHHKPRSKETYRVLARTVDLLDMKRQIEISPETLERKRRIAEQAAESVLAQYDSGALDPLDETACRASYLTALERFS